MARSGLEPLIFDLMGNRLTMISRLNHHANSDMKNMRMECDIKITNSLLLHDSDNLQLYFSK